MKILVIGGSYFFGRVFVMLASKEHEITVVNRGTYSLAEFGVQQIKGDRRDEGVWRSLEGNFDVIVDFCAYEPGDIARVLDNLTGKVRQYIFISTVDVYERGSGGRRGEDAPLETRIFPGEAGAYIAGKVALEREVREKCAEKGIHWTVLRPAILYGPFNYAPRESVYIRMMVQQHVLPRITDSKGEFQFVYVKDAAGAVLRCLLNEKAYGQAYNLCQDQVMTYGLLAEELKKAADVDVTVLSMTAEEAAERNVPLPFPVTQEESELYANDRSRQELGISYTGISEGMMKTYRAFKGVYVQA
ncbi:MAG: NAD-dependent epimerase/dehydratase family protein [Lachnospiraceae bacterium]|nr:NAD-dependent epimerase/dehydratase family protein [Lachnospiraceae bacterium]